MSRPRRFRIANRGPNKGQNERRSSAARVFVAAAKKATYTLASLHGLAGAVMRYLYVVLVICYGLFVLGCTYTPTLEAASGVSESNVLIRDVVRRVKCEISDAFDEKVENEKFNWLQNWTAKVDLTLQVNEQAGLTPSVAYTKFYHNAFNTAAGSTSLTNTMITAVSQFFTLSAAANLNGQAQRSETVSFTLSLKELKSWRRRQKLVQGRNANGVTFAELICDPNGAEFRGKLGLKEWVDSALYPVETRELEAGFHPTPANTPSKPPSPSTGSKGAFGTLSVIKVKEAKPKVDKSASKAKGLAKAASDSQNAVNMSVAHVQNHMETVIGPYLDVLTNDLRRIIGQNVKTILTIKTNANTDENNIEIYVQEIQAIRVHLASLQDDTDVPVTVVTNAQRFAMDADKSAKDAEKLSAAAKKIEDRITGFTPNPPVDAMLHSVQFVLTYGASVTPNWTLLQWKGPGLTVPGAAASTVRTHILNIALGPTSEQNRLIQNITIMNSGLRQ
jgi:hypothetical protein